jgi:penicillin-binding protein 1C
VTEYRAYEVWPSDLRQTLERAGIAKADLPAWRQDCLATTASVAGGKDQKPSITSPQSNVEYRVRMEDGNEAVPLSAKADGEVRSLHWFANNQYLGSSKSGETMSWRARPGQYLLRVVDDQGRSDMTRLQVVLTQ